MTQIKKTRIEVDMSDYAIEEVLSIECEDEKLKSITYLSKSLNKIERNYKIKMLVVIKELENQRHLLEGAKFKFKT